MKTAEDLINEFINQTIPGDDCFPESYPEASRIIEGQLNEQLVKLIWKKLSSTLKSKIDLKKLEQILTALEAGEITQNVINRMNLSPALASELLLAIEKSGLI